MKETTLLKMKYDLELTQKAVVVALNKIEALEKKFEENKEEKQQLLINCLYLQKQRNYVRRTILSILYYPRIKEDSK